MKKARVDYIDLFRSFGIILMVMGHIGFGGLFDKWIHAFHMPMFFFVSGYFYKQIEKEDLRGYAISKARSLLLPYAVFGCSQLLVLALFSDSYKSLIPLMLYLFENTNGMQPIPGALWFLTSMFIAEVIYTLIRTFIPNRPAVHLIVAITIVIGMVIPNYFRLPWGADTALVGVGFLHAGSMFRQSDKLDKLLNLKLLPSILSGGGITALIFLNYPVNLRSGNYHIWILFWVNAIGAIVVGWNIARILDQTLSDAKFIKVIREWLIHIGKNSIVYLCLNQFVITVIIKALSRFDNYGFILKIPELILTLLVLCIAEKIICHTKMKVVIGR